MYILNVADLQKRCLSIKSEHLFFANYYKRTGFCKKSRYYSIKCLKRKRICCCLQTN